MANKTLSADQMILLLNMLAENVVNVQKLEVIVAQMNHNFQKSDFFTLGQTLFFLLQHNDFVSTKEQRIAALILLYDLFKSDDIEKHVYFPCFITVLLTKKTARNLVNIDAQNDEIKDHSKLVNSYTETLNKFIPPTSKARIPVTIACPANKSANKNAKKEECNEFIRDLLVCNDSVLHKSYLPTFAMKEPPFLECDNEYIWLYPSASRLHLKLSYDESLLTHETIGKESLKQIVAKACTTSVNNSQQGTIINELEKNPKLVYHIGLSPNKLTQLIEYNPTIAIFLVQHLMQTPHISEYLNALVNMNISLHSMEVVNRLTTKVGLPAEFVHLYISNCIQTCENIGDKFMKGRLVRLLCVFIQSLIRSKNIDFKCKQMDREDRLLQERLDKLKVSVDRMPSDAELLDRLNRLKNVKNSSESQANSHRKLHLITTDKRSETQKVDDLLKELNCEVELDHKTRNVAADTVTLRIIRDDDDDDDGDNSDASSLLDVSSESETFLTSESDESEPESESSSRTNQRKIVR